MNKIVNRLSLTSNKFMSETHLKHPGFVYSFGGSFTKKIKRNRRSKEAGDSRYTYQNKLDKGCFQHDKVMEILRIGLEEQLLIKYCMINYLTILEIQNIMVIKVDSFQWFRISL